MICGLLSGNPCGDYELSLGQQGNQTHSICYDGSLYSSNLHFMETLELSLWRTPRADFKLSCFMWCTDHGQLPQKNNNGASTGIGNTILELVKTTTTITITLLKSWAIENRQLG